MIKNFHDLTIRVNENIVIIYLSTKIMRYLLKPIQLISIFYLKKIHNVLIEKMKLKESFQKKM